jgi:cytochrome bd-type quinol oxidase subunit 2
MEGVSTESQADQQKWTSSWVLRRVLLYVGLALASLTVFTLLFALSVRLGVTNKVNGWFEGGWIGFLLFTVLLFWITVRQSRRRWNHWSFWLAIACLLAIHCLAFVAILRIYPHWRVIWFWPITVVEAGIFGATLAWLFPEKRAKLRRHEPLNDTSSGARR